LRARRTEDGVAPAASVVLRAEAGPMTPTLHLPPSSTQRLLHEALPRAAEASFAAVELTLGADADDAAARRVAATANEYGVRIAAVSRVPPLQLVPPDPAGFAGARDEVRCWMRLAAAMKCPRLALVPADLRSRDGGRAPLAYCDALHLVADALSSLRHDAEALGVTLVLDHRDTRFLLSPAEVADLLDRVNSPYVGWCLDADYLSGLADPADWARTLAHRVRLVRFNAAEPLTRGSGGAEHSNVSALLAALREVGYEGPVSVADSGNARQAADRLRGLLERLPKGGSEARA